MITADDTTWRYAQTGTPDRVCLFFSVDTFTRSGDRVDGPTEDVSVETTAEEQAVLAGIIERGRSAFLAKKNA